MDPVSLETMEITSLRTADIFLPPQICGYKIRLEGKPLHINLRFTKKISMWRFLRFCGKKMEVVLWLIMIILCFGTN